MKIDNYFDLIRTQNEMWNNIPTEQYTRYSVKRGLRNPDGTGVLAGLTAIGEVHGYVIDEGAVKPIEGRLRYRGIDIEDLVGGVQKSGERFGFEETIFLLIFGLLPSKKELEDFKETLSSMMKLPSGFTEDVILTAPSKDIMNKLARCVLTMYSYDERPDDLSLPNLLRQSLYLIARMPVMIAHANAAKSHYFDKKSLILHDTKPGLSFAENFLHMIRPDNQFTDMEAEVLDLALMLHAEHGGGNNSAFAVRVLTSSNTDTYSTMSAAIGSLKGPKHGGANDAMLDMIREIKANVKNWEDKDEIYEYLNKILRKEAGDGKGLIYGLGHPVYTTSDPRTTILKKKAKLLSEKFGFEKEFALYDAVETLAPEAFRKFKNSSQPICPNVDFYSGFVYEMMGIPQALYTPIFAMSRIVGWCAHRIEEVTTGGRIIRPAYKSIVNKTSYIPIDERKKVL